MNKELVLWQFVAERLSCGRRVVLLVVATSSGSSPGRPGYKMAVADDGELLGSIGGGVMEVNLVDHAQRILSEPGATATGSSVDRVHRKNVTNASGMICSGKQTVIFKMLTPSDLEQVKAAIRGAEDRDGSYLYLTSESFRVEPPKNRTEDDFKFTRLSEADFEFGEQLGAKNDLFIVGGGH
ncbi:MAG TPA: XdhC family protein, partial [Pyrinomonadaceae bacterium]